MNIKTVACPTCRKTVDWDKQSTFKPFCSERCKLIDLGEWAEGKHAIPGKDAPASNDSENNT